MIQGNCAALFRRACECGKQQQTFLDLIPSTALRVNQVMASLDFMILYRLTKPLMRRRVRNGGTILSRLP